MNYWIFVWLAVLAISLVVEFFTFELVSIWIAVGSLLALFLALVGAGVEVQIIVAVAISVACILGLRKITLKFLLNGKEKTNIDEAIGKRVKLLSRTDEDEIGSAKYNGVVWSVKEENGKTVEAGCFAEVVKISGNKLIVRKIENEKKEK